MKTILKKMTLCFLGACMLLCAACNGSDTPAVDSGTGTFDQTTAPKVPTTEPDPEPEAPAFAELVDTLKPVAAWNCDGTSDGDKVTELVSGKACALVNCELTDGHFDKGIRFYSSKQGYVDLGAGTLGGLVDGKEAVTVSMWILPYLSSSLTYRLFNLQVNGSTAGIQVDYKLNSIQISARSSSTDILSSKLYTYNLDDGYVATQSEYTNEGRWQLLTLVVDFKNDDISLFINGKRARCNDTVSFQNDSFQMGTPSSEVDSFGGSSARRVMSFNGVMDSIMVFDRALTSAEVTQLYGEKSTAVSPVTDQKMIEALLYKMGESIAFYAGSGELIRNEYFENLSSADYSLKTVVKDGAAYIPKDAAKSCFDTVDGVAVSKIDGTDYINLEALCQANSMTLLADGDLFLVSKGSSRFDVDDDRVYLDRLALLFEEHQFSTIECAESRAVVAQSGQTYTYDQLSAKIGYCTCPSVVKRGESIFVSMDTNGAKVFVFESTDGGKTFAFRALIPSFHFATIFELNGDLYLMGAYTGSTENIDYIGITKSTDGGRTWSAMTAFKGVGDLNAHTTSNTVLIANGRVYKAYNGRGGTSFSSGCTAYMVSAPITADLLKPESWTLSNAVPFTTDLFTTHPNGSKLPTFAYIEEGNAVLGKNGEILAIYGVKAAPLCGYAAVLTCTADGKTMSFEKNGEGSIIEFPGGNSKFNVVYDEATGKYITFVNRNTDDRYWFQRNVLSLMVSEDFVHWEVVGDVLTDPTVMNDYISATKHGFQYVDFIIDGEDILFAVREAMDDSDCYHNANYLTFYRLKGYKQYLSK